MFEQKPLKMQIHDFITEFKSVPTSMIFAFFEGAYSEGKIKYALSRLKNSGDIYQTEDNTRTSLNRTYALESMNAHLIDALWILVSKKSENVQMYSTLKQKEYPKVLVFAIDNALYEISVLDPEEEMLYRSSILRRSEDFHSDFTIDIALVYDRINGDKALKELGFDAYCILDYPEEPLKAHSLDIEEPDETDGKTALDREMERYPTPTFYT